jgi:vitamin B12 transporter
MAMSIISPVQAETELKSMLVTATRTSISEDRLLSSTSVITRQDIERYNYLTIAEAIAALPGVNITNSGGLGKQTSLFVRGTESNHTQILINGVKLATNEFGMPQLEHIPLSHIERIEFVRGPQSSLYGSESIGGTIQIFTRQGAQDSLTPELSVSYGTHDTKLVDFAVSGGSSVSWFNLGVGHEQSDGFNSCDGISGTLFIGCFTTEPDKDGYRNNNLSFHLGHRFTEHTSFEVFSLYSEGETEFDGSIFVGNQTDFLQHTYGALFNTEISNVWSVTASFSQGKIESENNKDGININYADNKKNYFSLQNNIQLHPDHLLTIGFDYENDEIDTTNTFSEDERNNRAYFGQLLGNIGNTDYRISLRADDNEQFGQHTTGNAAIGYAFSNSLRVFASYGTAFSAPSLVDLYSPFGSNPLLDPEESESIELGFNGYHFNLDWSFAIFRTQIDDFIAYDSFYIPQNISKARIRGLELEASTTLSGINFDGQLTLLQPENQSSSANKGNILVRRSEHSFTLNAYKSFGKYSVASKLYSVGRRYDDEANTRKLAAYTTVDLTGSYQYSEDIQLQLKGANIFNQQYETVSGFHTDGANFLMTLRYRP